MSDEPSAEEDIGETRSKKIPWAKIIVFAVVALVGVLVYWQYGDAISLDALAQREGQLQQMFQDHYFLTIIAAILLYVIVAGISLPGAVPLTLAYGWFLGFWLGLVIVSVGSTGGAVVAFLLSRYLFRDWIQSRLSDRFQSLNKKFEQEGAYYLFTIRLIPLVPFFVVNTAMGLTRIRTVTYWWVSQIGMLPGTAAYVYAGSTVPNLQTLADDGIGKILSWQVLLAFAILGLLPITLKKLLPLFGFSPSDTAKSTESDVVTDNE
ncbi:TVP38/TMEM64 family inner membrane protein YdjZ [Polystyrenella longa]|uniref:TVP38/TMEM64 family membrane protein n=1 Tax=Polystyrenella longa TaxID=2528007 RepID=A0A518CST3_9PLAN|nr:TVP38/TMEM64 family protein [Polystyrenella longa]QDU82292.1 TVP38/TMEM64 family inner membrane protein YdjZ [Polystyrenella longa]